eukprot:6126731-Amphidinium_carterae.1
MVACVGKVNSGVGGNCFGLQTTKQPLVHHGLVRDFGAIKRCKSSVAVHLSRLAWDDMGHWLLLAQSAYNRSTEK